MPAMWSHRTAARQSVSRRGRMMLRFSLMLIFLAQTRTAYVTDPPSFADRLDKIYEKLEKFTVAPSEAKVGDKLYAKLERLNSLTPDRGLTDYDDELLSAIQMWGANDEQMRSYIQELQRIKDEEKSERLTDAEYTDADWNDEDDSDLDYANDVGEDWDPIEDEMGSTSKPQLVTPSAITKLDRPKLMEPVESAAEALVATQERPRILEEPTTPEERATLRRAALENISSVVRAVKCLTPQPRWLSVRKLAPAADIVYMPPCVKLHRCAPDSGCCSSEADQCAPVEGRYVVLPFFLNNANGNLTAARMVFYNHTRCACVSRDSLAARLPAARRVQADARPARPALDWRPRTEDPLPEEDHTPPPMMRSAVPRCTCPRLFRSRPADGACACVCDWADAARRRDCLSLARGREHFGLRDRMCIGQGACTAPACEHGTYDPKTASCPSKSVRRYKRRYPRRFHPDKTVVV